LRRLLAVDLKIGRFRAVDEGQMELYLRWLAKREHQSGEEMPLGLILCAGKSNEHVELLELERSGTRVAEYLTDLPPGEVLERRLYEAIRAARERFKPALEASQQPKSTPKQSEGSFYPGYRRKTSANDGIMRSRLIFAIGTGSDKDQGDGDAGFSSPEVGSQFGSQISANRTIFRLVVGLGGPVNSMV
jgi:hypothetical protein